MTVEDRAIPAPADNEVLINVKACGVCGTDVHIFDGDPGSADVTKPTILGHEFAGIVTAVGDKVSNLAVGDRVTVDPNLYCGNCTPCRDGVVHFCKNMYSYGVTLDGGFGEYCVVNEKVVYKLGNNTNYLQGAMVEPLGCCLHGIDMCNIKAGSKVVVIGGGMIGLLMLQLAKLEGASRVALLEPQESKRQVATKLGATVCIDPISTNAKQQLEDIGFGNVDVVIECVGRTSTIEQAIDIAGYQSVVMMFGLTKPDEAISVKPFQVFKKEVVIKSSFINPCTHQRALDLIDNNRVDVLSMVHDVVGLGELNSILSNPQLRAMGKYIVDPSK